MRTLMLGCADLENTTLTACENLQVDKFRLPHTRANRLYVLEEITAPTGYARLTEKIYIKATANAQTQKIEFAQVDSRGQNAKTLQFDADTASFTYQLPNKRINRIEFMKQDATGNPIHDPKAKFQLYQQQQNGKKNITLQNGATIKADTYGKEANIVNSNSFRYSSVPDGIYYLLETVAPQGMITPKYPVAVFHVKQGTVYSDAQDNKVAIKNYRLGRFKVIKTDDSAKPQKMQGVGFTLYQDPDFARKVGVEKKTNDLGVLYFTDLEAGTYYLKETTVPKGYKAAKPLKVVVTPEGKTLVEQPAGAAQPITVTDAAHAAAAGTGTTPASAAATPLDLTNKLGTLHQKDPKFPNGNTQRVTINSGVRPEAQDIFLNQEIVPAGAPNTYQVNATISGAGMVNQRVATDVLIMLERRKQGVDMYGDGNFYRDQISKHIIQPLQAKLPAGSRISVHVWGTDAVYRNVSNSEVMPFTDIQNANAVFMQNSGKLNYATDWHTRHFYYPGNEKYGFSKIILDTMNKSNQNSRRVVVSYAGHGLNDYKHNPSILASEWNNNDSANFHQPQNKTYLREIMRDYEFYSFEEAGAQGRTRHLNPKFDPNDPSSPQYNYEFDKDRWTRFTPLGDEFYTIGEAVGVQESHMLQATSYFEEIKDAVDSGQYSLQLQKIADMIGSENGKLELKLSNNVIFDAAKSLKAGTNKIEFKSIGLLKPGNGKDPEISYNQATGMIEGKNFQVSPVNGGKANPSITFSYYLKAKAEAAELNKYQPINSFARYNAGINSGGVQMLPIPQVKIPGAIYTLNRQWHRDVSESDKNRQTLVSLIRKDNKGTAVVQSKIYKSEANTAFEAVPVYDENGIAFEYSIVENGLPEYLGTEMQYNNQTGYTAIKGADAGTQMRTPVKLYGYPLPVEYAVRKLWENTPADQRKAVTLQLQGHIGEQAVNLTELGVAATTVELNNSKNFVHVFKNLPALKEGQKIRYSVIETALDGKAINPEEFQAQYAYSNTSATITNIKTSEVTIANKHANYLKILKRDAETGVVQPLNARFEIQKLTADGSSADPNYRYAGWTYQNNNDGLAINHDTPAGKYRLTELIAPAGYEKIAAPIIFEIPAKYTSEIVINKFAKLSYDTATHTYLLTVTNNRITEIPGRFPLTGDIGIWIYIGIGAIIATIAIIWLRRRTRVQEE
ncbi:MSCRAMM family protein [Arcanobacterium hippocoleae]|uniref:MSCRAMM family protein n=1 Tax=Arcanobacterium hippocoleae TaxID=149017 RepID=UPI003340BBD0